MSEWKPTRPGKPQGWWERRPYDECPNCGKHKYRKLRLYHAGIIRCIILGRDSYYTVYSSCKNCRYTTEQKKVDGDKW